MTFVHKISPGQQVREAELTDRVLRPLDDGADRWPACMTAPEGRDVVGVWAWTHIDIMSTPMEA